MSLLITWISGECVSTLHSAFTYSKNFDASWKNDNFVTVRSFEDFSRLNGRIASADVNMDVDMGFICSRASNANTRTKDFSLCEATSHCDWLPTLSLCNTPHPFPSIPLSLSHSLSLDTMVTHWADKWCFRFRWLQISAKKKKSPPPNFSETKFFWDHSSTFFQMCYRCSEARAGRAHIFRARARAVTRYLLFST